MYMLVDLLLAIVSLQAHIAAEYSPTPAIAVSIRRRIWSSTGVEDERRGARTSVIHSNCLRQFETRGHVTSWARKTLRYYRCS